MQTFDQRRYWLIAAAIVLTAGFAMLAANVQSGFASAADEGIRSSFHDWASSSATLFFSLVTHAGSSVVLFPLAGGACIVLWRVHQRRPAYFLAFTMAGSIVLENGLKYLFQRPRPEPFFGLPAPESFSFPSGHALFATCLFGGLAIIAGRADGVAWRILPSCVAVILVGAVGLSRVYLGMHYPSDVLGGILIGTAWVLIASAYFGTENKKMPGTRPG